jgi:hypothetical protein
VITEHEGDDEPILGLQTEMAQSMLLKALAILGVGEMLRLPRA